MIHYMMQLKYNLFFQDMSDLAVNNSFILEAEKKNKWIASVKLQSGWETTT